MNSFKPNYIKIFKVIYLEVVVSIYGYDKFFE